jgi:hypothetical protein
MVRLVDLGQPPIRKPARLKSCTGDGSRDGTDRVGVTSAVHGGYDRPLSSLGGQGIVKGRLQCVNDVLRSRKRV